MFWVLCSRVPISAMPGQAVGKSLTSSIIHHNCISPHLSQILCHYSSRIFVLMKSVTCIYDVNLNYMASIVLKFLELFPSTYILHRTCMIKLQIRFDQIQIYSVQYFNIQMHLLQSFISSVHNIVSFSRIFFRYILYL